MNAWLTQHLKALLWAWLTRGNPASRVPAGQIHLQNQVWPKPNASSTTAGKMTTVRTSTKYFKY